MPNVGTASSIEDWCQLIDLVFQKKFFFVGTWVYHSTSTFVRPDRPAADYTISISEKLGCQQASRTLIQ